MGVSNHLHKVIPMTHFSYWLRQQAAGFGGAFRRFFAGRYGHDRLNMLILTLGLILCVLGIFTKGWWIDLVLTMGSYALLIWALFRCFSRNHYKRYQENRKYLLMLDRLKDRDNRYFVCPRCHQTVRVPRGKGKISITCPRCKEKFVRKT